MAGAGRRRRKVSMADVAAAANVSVTTVSHVVNRSRPVAPETEAAVLAAVAETGYVPDDVVRSMRTSGSRTVGLAMSAITNTYFSDVVRSIEGILSRAGYSLLLVDTHDDVRTEMRAISDLLTRGVDAIVLAPSADPTKALEHARQQAVPVIMIDRFSEFDFDQIGSENDEPTAFLVDHLAELGHRRIAFVAGKAGLSTSTERFAGYQRGLARNGIDLSPEYAVDGDSTDVGAGRALAQLLELESPPSALVVGNNQMTIGVMRRAKEADIRIPDDLAVICFDDFEWADCFHPGLTVMAQPIRAMGQQAAEMVLSRLADPGIPSRRVVLRPVFMHRESCGCLQRHDRVGLARESA